MTVLSNILTALFQRQRGVPCSVEQGPHWACLRDTPTKNTSQRASRFLLLICCWLLPLLLAAPTWAAAKVVPTPSSASLLLPPRPLAADASVSGAAEGRFPPPDFRNGYNIPGTRLPAPRGEILHWLDVALLAACLAVAAWAVHKRRSRWIVFGLTIFSLAYFGFYRQGCVCPVGSIQNVTLGIFDPAYTIPWTVAAFFALPLVFALFCGRVFCAGVCPLGAIQDLVLWKPIQVRPWIETTLGLFAYAYLGLALLLAATGSQFVICSWDPFVSIFRLSGTIGIILLGVGLLIASMFVGRVYCRFICPYSVLLRLTSRLSQWKVHISPASCVDCRLCEKSCPYGAILLPIRDAAAPDASRLRQRRLIGATATILLLIGGAWAGWAGRGILAQLNQTVQLARTIQSESATTAPSSIADADLTQRVQAWHNQGETPEALYTRATLIQHRFGLGGAILGAGFLLIVGKRFLTHLAPPAPRRLNLYDADPAGCLACARCFKHCPVERQHRGQIAPPAPASIPAEEAVT